MASTDLKAKINVKNFHESLTTVVRAQNDTTKTANITYTISIEHWYVLKIGQIRCSVSC